MPATIAGIGPGDDGISAHEDHFALAVPIIGSEPARIGVLDRCLTQMIDDFGYGASGVSQIDDAFVPADDAFAPADEDFVLVDADFSRVDEDLLYERLRETHDVRAPTRWHRAPTREPRAATR